MRSGAGAGDASIPLFSRQCFSTDVRHDWHRLALKSGLDSDRANFLKHSSRQQNQPCLQEPHQSEVYSHFETDTQAIVSFRCSGSSTIEFHLLPVARPAGGGREVLVMDGGRRREGGLQRWLE